MGVKITDFLSDTKLKYVAPKMWPNLEFDFLKLKLISHQKAENKLDSYNWIGYPYILKHKWSNVKWLIESPVQISKC